MKNLSIEDPGKPADTSVRACEHKEGSFSRAPSHMSPAEAIHLGSLIAAHGYIFPISDHVLTLKDDGTLYRFQVKENPTLALALDLF